MTFPPADTCAVWDDGEAEYTPPPAETVVAAMVYAPGARSVRVVEAEVTGWLKLSGPETTTLGAVPDGSPATDTTRVPSEGPVASLPPEQAMARPTSAIGTRENRRNRRIKPEGTARGPSRGVVKNRLSGGNPRAAWRWRGEVVYAQRFGRHCSAAMHTGAPRETPYSGGLSSQSAKMFPSGSATIAMMPNPCWVGSATKRTPRSWSRSQ